MREEVIFAGFGGQGVMVMGQLLTYAAMMEGRQVSWMPSYGPEMRGGTANCAVVVADDDVGSPVVTEPDTVVIMNRPSMDKFEPMVKPGGCLIYNSSLIKRAPVRTDIRVYAVPGNDIASELGNDKVANMVVFGAYLKLRDVVLQDSVLAALKKVLPPHRHDLIPLNREALDRGGALVEGTSERVG